MWACAWWFSGSVQCASAATSAQEQQARAPLETDPAALWRRYQDWLYSLRDEDLDLDITLDISRMGFTDAFVKSMEPKVGAPTCLKLRHGQLMPAWGSCQPGAPWGSRMGCQPWGAL